MHLCCCCLFGHADLANHRKSFVETRSIGTVAVAFSRVYIVHAILLCWMSLLVGARACVRSLRLCIRLSTAPASRTRLRSRPFVLYPPASPACV